MARGSRAIGPLFPLEEEPKEKIKREQEKEKVQPLKEVEEKPQEKEKESSKEVDPAPLTEQKPTEKEKSPQPQWDERVGGNLEEVQDSEPLRTIEDDEDDFVEENKRKLKHETHQQISVWLPKEINAELERFGKRYKLKKGWKEKFINRAIERELARERKKRGVKKF